MHREDALRGTGALSHRRHSAAMRVTDLGHVATRNLVRPPSPLSTAARLGRDVQL